VGKAANQKLSPCTKTINLGGRTVVPGLIDNHNHIVLLGMRPGEEQILNRRGRGEMPQRTPRMQLPPNPAGLCASRR